MTDNTNNYGLSKDRGVFAVWDNLLSLLGQEIPNEQMLDRIKFIEKYNEPSKTELDIVFNNVKQHLESEEPNKLPYFKMLMKLRDFKARLADYVSNPDHDSEDIETAFLCFEENIRNYLDRLYTGEEFYEFSFPSWIKDSRWSSLNRRQSKELTKFWNELLDLWLEQFDMWNDSFHLWVDLLLPANVKREIEEFRKIINRSV